MIQAALARIYVGCWIAQAARRAEVRASWNTDWAGQVLRPTGRSDGDCKALRLPRPTGSVRIRRAAPLGSYGTTPISSSGVYANLTTASQTSRMRLQPSKWINFRVGDSRSTRDLLRGPDPHILTRDMPSGKVRHRRTVFAGSKSTFLRPQPANITVRFHLRDKGMAATIVLRFGVVQLSKR
jgi:hypothetical protein